ncbi:MAG: CGNR zinc finger domain-containing protein [Betaproteobacteria bacterium]
MVTASSPERSEPGYRFDFCGGHVAIDFTNTVGSRGSEPQEHFQTYGDVVAWLEAREMVSAAGAARLRHEAAADPPAAARAYHRALELREVLYRLMAARTAHRPPRAADLETLNAFVAETFSRARLAKKGRELTLVMDDDRPELAAALNPVIRAAIELLTAPAMNRVRVCGDPACGWLFLDTTRSGTRRWCDMQTCGNRAKVRRFRRRQA